MKNLQDAGIDNVFFLEKSCTKMYTIFSAVQCQQRKNDVMTSFGVTACSAVYYHAGSSFIARVYKGWKTTTYTLTEGVHQYFHLCYHNTLSAGLYGKL
jgi:hypothetical protein